MVICKNCIHQIACKQMCHYHNYPFYEQGYCDEFADKELYIKIPCKVGDTVYAISRGDIIPIVIDRIQRHNRGIDIFGRNEKYFGYGTIMLDCENKIGLEWYKTKEEAETALKKMGSMELLKNLQYS